MAFNWESIGECTVFHIQVCVVPTMEKYKLTIEMRFEEFYNRIKFKIVKNSNP